MAFNFKPDGPSPQQSVTTGGGYGYPMKSAPPPPLMQSSSEFSSMNHLPAPYPDFSSLLEVCRAQACSSTSVPLFTNSHAGVHGFDVVSSYRPHIGNGRRHTTILETHTQSDLNTAHSRPCVSELKVNSLNILPNYLSIPNTSVPLAGHINPHCHIQKSFSSVCKYPNSSELQTTTVRNPGNGSWCSVKTVENSNKEKTLECSSLSRAVESEPKKKVIKTRKRKGRNIPSDKTNQPKLKRVRFIKPGCADMCRRRCKEKMSQSIREDLFNEYWNLETDTLKKEFIGRHAIKMPMVKCKEGSRRSFSMDWAFNLKGESYSVCKLFFLHTLDIPESIAYAAIKDIPFANDSKPLIDTKSKARTSAAMWFETDLDDYSTPQRKNHRSKGKLSTIKETFSLLRPGCSACRRKCQSKFSHEDRMHVFNMYKGFSNIRKQREFISKYLVRTEKKRIQLGVVTRRGCSMEWSLPLKGSKVSVCKTFFLHTLGISERTAHTIGELQGDLKPVMRAMSQKTNKKESSLSSQSSHATSGRKSSNVIIAKGKLKSALRYTRRKKELSVIDEFSDSETEVEDYVEIDETYRPTSELKRKGRGSTGIAIQGRKRQKRKPDKTYKCKMVVQCYEENETNSSDGDQVAPQVLRQFRNKNVYDQEFQSFPVKKRKGTLPKMLPVLRIKRLRTTPIVKGFCKEKQRRGPYKTKAIPTQLKIPPCLESCRKRCRSNVPEDARRKIFDTFWKLENMEEQRKFISNCVMKKRKATCTCLIATKSRESRRGYTIHWSLNVEGDHYSVCKTFFLHVLQIRESRVYRSIDYDASDSVVSTETVQPCKHFTGRSSHRNSAEKNDSEIQVKDINTSSTSSTSGCFQEVEMQSSKSVKELQKSGDDICSSKEESYSKNNGKKCSPPQDTHGSLDAVGLSKHGQELTGDTAQFTALPKDGRACNDDSRNYDSFIHHGRGAVETLLDEIGSLPLLPTSSSVQHFTQLTQAPHLHVSAHNTIPTAPTSSVELDIMSNRFESDNLLALPKSTVSTFTSCHNYPVPSSIGDFATLPPQSHSSCSSQNIPHFPFPIDTRTNNYCQNVFPQSGNIPLFGCSTVSRDGCGDAINELMNFPFDSKISSQNVPLTSQINPLPVGKAPQERTYMRPSQSMFENRNRISSTCKESMLKKKSSSHRRKQKQSKFVERETKKRKKEKPFTRQIKAGCQCKRKCGMRVSQNAREQMFNRFWSLENDTKRREYIISMVRKIPKKTCSGVNSRRGCTIEWKCNCEEELQIVCKKFFLDTLDVGETFVMTSLDKLEKTGTMKDMRGKHNIRSRLFAVEHEEMESHIRSMSTLKGIHCTSCKKDFTRWFLEPQVSMMQFYKLYVNKRTSAGAKAACRSSFVHLCTRKFGIRGLGWPPREDLCDRCIDLLPNAESISLNFSENER